MTFASEQKLEIHLRDLITTRITAEHPYIYALGNKMAVDIVICRDRERPAVFFLEVKLFQPGHNRLGIGAGKGNGYQPEIIAHTPEYFDKHLRWIIVDGRQAVPSYIFAPTTIIRQFLARGELGHKQNNIRLRIFSEVAAYSEAALVDELRKWLLE